MCTAHYWSGAPDVLAPIQIIMYLFSSIHLNVLVEPMLTVYSKLGKGSALGGVYKKEIINLEVEVNYGEKVG